MLNEALYHLEQLSIWELAHRLAGFDPDDTDPDHLPQRVRDTLRDVVTATSITLNVYDEHGELTAQDPTGLPWYLRPLVKTDGYEALNAARRNRVYAKAALDRLYVDRDELAMQCLRYGRRLPEFWFQYGDIEYYERLRPSYGPPLDVDAATPHTPQTDECDSTPLETEPATEERNEQQRKAALAKHAKTHRLKRNFIRYRLAGNGRSDRDAAQRFYKQLPPEDAKQLSPSNACRTFCQAMTTFKKGLPVPWLADFDPASAPE